jgi:hypothetical protein
MEKVTDEDVANPPEWDHARHDWVSREHWGVGGEIQLTDVDGEHTRLDSITPIPSCPVSLRPQHLRAASDVGPSPTHVSYDDGKTWEPYTRLPRDGERVWLRWYPYVPPARS